MRCVKLSSWTFREASWISSFIAMIKVLDQLDGDTQTWPKTWCTESNLSPQSTDTWKNQRHLNTFSSNGGWSTTTILFLLLWRTRKKTAGGRISAQRENIRQQLNRQVVYGRRVAWVVVVWIGVHCISFGKQRNRVKSRKSELCRECPSHAQTHIGIIIVSCNN
jgi:hypothetical protein